MADDVQALIAELALNSRRIESQQRRLVRSFDTAFSRIEKGSSQRLTNIEKRAESMSRNVRRAIVAIGVGIAGREVLEYEASWRAVTNTLKQYSDVLGPAQQSASALNKIAQDARAPLSELSGLTGAAARSARDLGKSGADVLVFGETAAKGARLANTGSAAVEGAFIQLSQAIASPRVQLQEFNSIIEGTPRLAQAFAEGIDKADGSVAKLRALIAKGEISGGDLFDALISQADKVRTEFATLDQGPKEAITRLQDKLTEFIGTNDKVKAGAAGLVEVIDLAADNLDILADSIVVGSAALGGFFGAQGLLAVAGNLRKVAVGATATAKAVAILEAGMAFFGGPIPLAVGGVAAALAYLALRGNEADRAMRTLEDATRRAEAALRDTAKYVSTDPVIEKIGDQAGDSSGPVGGLALGLERVAAALQDVTVQQFLQDMAAIQTEIRDVEQEIADAEKARERERAKAAANTGLGTQASIAAGTVTYDVDTSELDKKIGAAKATLSGLQKRQLRIGLSLFGDGSGQDIADRIASGDIAGAADLLKKRLAAVTADTGSGSGGSSADLSKSEEAALQKIRDAYSALFETERDQIARVRDEHIKAINDAAAAGKISTTDAESLRTKANDTYKRQLSDIRNQEFEDFNDYVAEQEKKAAKETSLVNQVVDARDRASGRLATILGREYDLRRAQIELEIKDEAKKNAALAALDEERAQAEKDLHDRLLEEGQYSRDPLERYKANLQKEQEALDDALANKLISHQEYDDALAAMKQEHRDEERQAEIDNQQTILSATQGFVSTLGQLAEQRFGKNSALAKAFFLTQQIASAAQVVLSAEVAKIRALAELGPIAGPPAAAAIEVAKNISLATIAAQTVAGFKDGVVGLKGPGTARSDSIPIRASRGESIITEAGTRLNPNLLQRINAGEDVEGQLARAGQPIGVNAGFLTAGGRPISIGGSSFIFNGPVDRSVLPEFEAMLAERDRALRTGFAQAIDRDKTLTTPRHERNRFFKG